MFAEFATAEACSARSASSASAGYARSTRSHPTPAEDVSPPSISGAPRSTGSSLPFALAGGAAAYLIQWSATRSTIRSTSAGARRTRRPRSSPSRSRWACSCHRRSPYWCCSSCSPACRTLSIRFFERRRLRTGESRSVLGRGYPRRSRRRPRAATLRELGASRVLVRPESDLVRRADLASPRSSSSSRRATHPRCRLDLRAMIDQSKVRALRPELAFLRTARDARPAGWSSPHRRGQDDHDGELADATPPPLIPSTADALRRGRDRFEVFCAPCHGLLGDGTSAVAERMAPPAPAVPRDTRNGALRPARIVRDDHRGIRSHALVRHRDPVVRRSLGVWPPISGRSAYAGACLSKRCRPTPAGARRTDSDDRRPRLRPAARLRKRPESSRSPASVASRSVWSLPRARAIAYLVAFAFYGRRARRAVPPPHLPRDARRVARRVRRLLEALVEPIPLLAVLFLPVLGAADVVYPWVTGQRRSAPMYARAPRPQGSISELPFFLPGSGLFRPVDRGFTPARLW